MLWVDLSTICMPNGTFRFSIENSDCLALLNGLPSAAFLIGREQFLARLSRGVGRRDVSVFDVLTF